MVYGRATTQGLSPEAVSQMYPDMGGLNYAQNLTSVRPTFNDGRYISPLDSLQYSYVNKFGNNRVVHFNRENLMGTVNGKKYEVYPKNKIKVGTKNYSIGSRVGQYTITNIGKRQVILSDSTGKTIRPKIHQFINSI